MRLKLLLNRMIIALDALVRSRIKVNKKVGKTVVIVFQQIFGDALVISNTLEQYTKLFPRECGYKVLFVARPSVIKFMRDTVYVPDEIIVEALDYKKFLEDYSYYRECIKKYRAEADILIVPGTSMSAEIFATACNTPRRIALIRSIDVTKPFINSLFSKIAYTETVRPNKEDMMLQRHRQFLNYLGANDYKVRLPVLSKKDKIIEDDKYCVMCPGASKIEKCWPTNRFVEIADYIIEKYNMNIHLCGGADELEYENYILKHSKHVERIISHIGKTNFSDWSAIVQYADLVVGNDSATMHLAVASRRKAVCIAGAYDKYQFFPYKVDVLEEGEILPITMLKDMPCEWCRTIGYDAGYGNDECKRRIQDGLCACCIDLITVQEVKKEIDLLMIE